VLKLLLQNIDAQLHGMNVAMQLLNGITHLFIHSY